MITGLKNPESVAIGPDGKIYISVIGEFNKDGDGAIMKVVDGKAVPFATGLNDPKGLTSWQRWLFTADKNQIWKIDMQAARPRCSCPPLHSPGRHSFSMT